MIADQNIWNLDLVKDIFSETDANLILTIPIQRMDNDSWFWKEDKLGQYMVKSAYAIIRDNAVNSHTSSNYGFWNQNWNLKIPIKVRHFMWRAIRECLPIKDTLRSRRIKVDIKCPVCNLNEETSIHALLTCPIAALC